MSCHNSLSQLQRRLHLWENDLTARFTPPLRSISFTHSFRRRFSHKTYERKILPPELSRNVLRLSCESSANGGVCDVYLVGTCHVSTKSCQEVRAVIEYLKPKALFLELCPSRYAALAPHNSKNFKVPTMGDMMNMWKGNKNILSIMYSYRLAKVASILGVVPGEEFRVAFEEAMKYGHKVNVKLGDRPVDITFQRIWAKMSLWYKTKLLCFPLFIPFFAVFLLLSPEYRSKILKLKDVDLNDVDMNDVVDRKDVDRLIQAFSKHFPTLMETLVDERDQFMSASILSLAREHNLVVAVVGRGHLRGIEKNWKQPIEVEELLSIPSGNKRIGVAKILVAIAATVAGAAIISGIKN